MAKSCPVITSARIENHEATRKFLIKPLDSASVIKKLNPFTLDNVSIFERAEINATGTLQNINKPNNANHVMDLRTMRSSSLLAIHSHLTLFGSGASLVTIFRGFLLCRACRI